MAATMSNDIRKYTTVIKKLSETAVPPPPPLPTPTTTTPATWTHMPTTPNT